LLAADALAGSGDVAGMLGEQEVGPGWLLAMPQRGTVHLLCADSHATALLCLLCLLRPCSAPLPDCAKLRHRG
jgi:hypothetical protein